MTPIDKDTINLNYRALLLLGIATAMISEGKSRAHRNEHYKYDWFMDAVNAVVYKGEPLPPMPDKDLL